jgi:hypothetical protein
MEEEYIWRDIHMGIYTKHKNTKKVLLSGYG